MFRRTYTTTLHTPRPIPDDPSASGRAVRMYLRLENGAIIELSAGIGDIVFSIDDGRFSFEPAEGTARFRDPFALDTDQFPARRTADVKIYVPAADGPRDHPTPVYVESHAPGRRGFQRTFAHRPSETVYRTATLPGDGSDPLLDDQVAMPTAPDDATVLENVATGTVGVVTEQTVAAATDRGDLTTVLPARWPGKSGHR